MFGDIDQTSFMEGRSDLRIGRGVEQRHGQRLGWSSGGIEARPYPDLGVVAALKRWVWRHHWGCIVCLMITGGGVAGVVASAFGALVPVPAALIQWLQP